MNAARFVVSTSGSGSNFRALVYLRPNPDNHFEDVFVCQSGDRFRSRPEATKWSKERIELLTRGALAVVLSASRLHNDGETAGGLTGDDALELLEGLISGARAIVGDPGYPEASS